MKERKRLSHLEAKLFKGMERRVTKEEMFYDEGDETLAQVVHRSYRCPVTGSAQGWMEFWATQSNERRPYPRQEGWTRWTLKVSSNSKPSMTSDWWHLYEDGINTFWGCLYWCTEAIQQRERCHSSPGPRTSTQAKEALEQNYCSPQPQMWPHTTTRNTAGNISFLCVLVKQEAQISVRRQSKLHHWKYQ